MAEAICDLWCEGCIFLPLHATVYCDYFTIVGRRRPCPAGTGCTERILRKQPPRPDERLREQDRARRAAEEREAAEKKAQELAALREARETVKEAVRVRNWAAEQKREELRELRNDNLRRWLATMPPDMRLQRETILAWRREQQLTQRDLARMIGVSEKTMHDWEMGRYRAKWDKLEEVGCRRP